LGQFENNIRGINRLLVFCASYGTFGSMIDEMDRRILSLLQQDARLPNAEIARRVGMAPSATLERLRKLEERGVIVGYEVRLDPRKLGLGVTAFIFVKAQDKQGEVDTGERLKQHPNVLEVHHIAGEDCYLAKVRTTDTEELGRLLRADFNNLPGVQSTRTTIVLGTLKESARIPVPEERGVAIA
jgi:Lrp/AsnC family transcriptional regulator, leucine-responsive regulatory protein